MIYIQIYHHVRKVCLLVIVTYCVFTATCSGALPNSVIQPGYCPTVWASGLAAPRTLEVASNGDILTVESAQERITVLWDDNNDGLVQTKTRP